ncbi:MAG: efflux RND transporter permease subunit [Alphaproteobacteria bacterium]
MNSIINEAFARKRTVLMTFFLILISGLISFIDIPKESSPDVNIPYIIVGMTYRGISPEDSERLLIKPMEQELRAVEGVKEMTATAYEGGAQVVLEFNAGFDSDKALTDVREKVDTAKPDLPSETDEPTVDELNFSLFPIIVVTLTGDVPERSLIKIARSLQDELEGLPEVLEADIAGDRDEQVEIIIDPAMVESYGISASELSSFLIRSNTLVAAGSLDTGKGRFAIKVPGLLKEIQDIMDLPVKVNGDAVVRLSDIATGRRAFKDATGYARVGGKPSVALEVSKRTGENVINTVEKVKEIVERERKYWPEGINVTYNQDQSKDIKDMLNDLQNSVISAIILVMIVVIAALGVRTGLLVGISIPGSFLMAILAIYIMGYTINMVVLFALILAVGMLVDGAIVVTEYADREMNEGKNRETAYSDAAKRMAWPVIASTATTLAAFAPLIFWTGIVGEFMKYLPITLIATLLASLVMAIIFVPTLGGLIGKPVEQDKEVTEDLENSEHGDITKIHGFTGKYARILSKALDNPGKIIIAALIMLFVAPVIYGMYGRGLEFFPNIEPSQALIRVHARGNLSVEEKDAFVKDVEKFVLGMDDFKAVYARSGYSGNDAAEDVIGVVNLEFKEWDERRPAAVVIEEIREKTKDVAGYYIEVREQEEGPRQGKPISVELSSKDPTLLPEAANHIEKAMEELGGFVDIEDTLPLPGIQWNINVDRTQAAKFSVDVSSVGDMVQLITNGIKFSSYRPDDSDDEIDIVARYPEEYRSISQINRLKVATSSGIVPISSFVTLTPEPMVSNIYRTDSKRVITVKSDVAKGVLANDKVVELGQYLQKNPLNENVTFKFKGEDEDQKESQAFLSKAFGIALFIMAIILVTQFNSFYSTFLILTAVILSTIGVLLGLVIFQQPFGVIMTGIGVISLAGIVVNNNIILIDTYDLLKKQYSDPKEAIVRTGAQRLRPVLLTTTTTILGLIPMMIALNIDFVNRNLSIGAPSMQWWVQLSTAVVNGLAFATILTLIVTPCALMLQAKFMQWFDKKFFSK